MSSWLSPITQAPPDAIFGVAAAFKADVHPDKMNLSVGAYRDEDGQPWVLPVVREAEQLLLSQALDHEYLPQLGLPALRQAAPLLLFGRSDADATLLSRVACLQTLSGTGALRVVGAFLKQYHPSPAIYITDPTWGNHVSIFESCGFRVEKLRYYDPATCGLAIDQFLLDISQAPEQSILVLHTCAHNPTGVDPTPEQWTLIEAAVAKRRHTVIFDTAYQGYASGDLDRDAYGLRLFAARGHELIVCQSFAKNMGLYGERVGTACVVCPSRELVEPVLSRLEKIVRAMYSNPPKQGALLAATILTTPNLYNQWLAELKHMSDRIQFMRARLHSDLMSLGTPGNWDHITSQIGMFTYTGLTPTQVEYLVKEHHIYMLSSGRIAMTGLTQKNVNRLAVCMDQAVRKFPAAHQSNI